MIETFLDPAFNLCPFARIALRTALGNAAYFVSMILSHFYTRDTLEILLPHRQQIDDVYSEFTTRQLRTFSSSHPLFYALKRDIGNRKRSLDKIAKTITDDRQVMLRHAVVHRVLDDKKHLEFMGKKIVLDPTNPSRFSSVHYHQMHSETSYIVGESSDGPIQLHLFVNDTLCRGISDRRIIETLFSNARTTTKFAKAADLWFVGVHITNLHRIKQIATFMKEASPILLSSAKKLRHVGRSDTRENSGDRKSGGSRMFELGSGCRVDQTGCLQSPHNFKKPSTDPIMKYDLLSEDDYILDGVKTVDSWTPAELTEDYPCVPAISDAILEG